MKISNKLFNLLCAQAQTNERLRISYDLRNSKTDTSQRMLNVLQPGTHIDIHRHRESSEVVIVIRGAIREIFYDNNGNITESIKLRQGDDVPMHVIPKNTWHNLECLEPDTIIFECKDGAYKPLDTEDIRR